jgi:hypothetical protein
MLFKVAIVGRDSRPKHEGQALLFDYEADYDVLEYIKTPSDATESQKIRHVISEAMEHRELEPFEFYNYIKIYKPVEREQREPKYNIAYNIELYEVLQKDAKLKEEHELGYVDDGKILYHIPGQEPFIIPPSFSNSASSYIILNDKIIMPPIVLYDSSKFVYLDRVNVNLASVIKSDKDLSFADAVRIDSENKKSTIHKYSDDYNEELFYNSYNYEVQEIKQLKDMKLMAVNATTIYNPLADDQNIAPDNNCAYRAFKSVGLEFNEEPILENIIKYVSGIDSVYICLYDASGEKLVESKAPKGKGLYGIISCSHLYIVSNKTNIKKLEKNGQRHEIGFDTKYQKKCCDCVFLDSTSYKNHEIYNHKNIKLIKETFEESIINIYRKEKQLPIIKNGYVEWNGSVLIPNIHMISDKSAKILGVRGSIEQIGRMFLCKSLLSTINPLLREIFVDRVGPMTDTYKITDKCYQYDYVKFYRTILSLGELPIFDASAVEEDFNGFIVDNALYKCSIGWRYGVLAREYGGITKQILPSRIGSLNHVINKFIGLAEGKELVNYMIGSMGITENKFKHNYFIVDNCYEYSYFLAKGYKCLPIDNSLYLFYSEVVQEKEKNFYPIYKYIVEYGRAIMYRHIKELGNKVVAVRTDAIYTDSLVELKVDSRFRVKEPVLVRGFYSCGTEYMLPGYESKEWSSGVGLVLGAAGSGKTTFISKYLEGKKYIACAFQNNIACAIGGITLHKLLGLDIDENMNFNIENKFKNIEYLWIDEIQMCSANVLNKLALLKKKYGFSVVCSGDFSQLKTCGTVSYNSPVLKYLCDYKVMTLTSSHRIKDLDYMAAIAKKDFSYCMSKCSKYKGEELFTITYYRSKGCDVINSRYQDKFDKFSDVAVICHTGNAALGLIKGIHYYVSDGVISIDKRFHNISWSAPVDLAMKSYLKLGYAFTAHSIIGITMECPVRIVLRCPSKYRDEFLTVALTRTRDPINNYI